MHLLSWFTCFPLSQFVSFWAKLRCICYFHRSPNLLYVYFLLQRSFMMSSPNIHLFTIYNGGVKTSRMSYARWNPLVRILLGFLMRGYNEVAMNHSRVKLSGIGKLFKFSSLYFSHLQNGNSNSVCRFFFFFYFLATHSMWKSPSQESNLHHSSDPSHWRENDRSLTCCATRELQVPVF